jgi:hypothetical protein
MLRGGRARARVDTGIEWRIDPRFAGVALGPALSAGRDLAGR